MLTRDFNNAIRMLHAGSCHRKRSPLGARASRPLRAAKMASLPG